MMLPTRVVPRHMYPADRLTCCIMDVVASCQACGGESGVVDLFHMTSGDSMRSFSAGAGIRSLCYHEDTVRYAAQMVPVPCNVC